MYIVIMMNWMCRVSYISSCLLKLHTRKNPVLRYHNQTVNSNPSSINAASLIHSHISLKLLLMNAEILLISRSTQNGGSIKHMLHTPVPHYSTFLTPLQKHNAPVW